MFSDGNFLRIEWAEVHDLNLCREVLVVELSKSPYHSKEWAYLWNQIAANLNAYDYPKFKVSETRWHYFNKYKATMRMEEAASWIDSEETNQAKALEEIIEKKKAVTDAKSL